MSAFYNNKQRYAQKKATGMHAKQAQTKSFVHVISYHIVKKTFAAAVLLFE